MAQLILVGVYAAGPRARARRDRVIDSLAAMLAPGFADNPRAPAVSAEAIAATAYSLMREQLRREGAASLPRRRPARHLRHPGRIRRARGGAGDRQRQAAAR